MAPFIHDDGCEARPTPSHTTGGEPGDSVDEISVAVEWKLLLPLLPHGVADPQPSDGRSVLEVPCHADEQDRLALAHDGVAKVIREVGERAVTMHAIRNDALEEGDFWASTWIVKKANSAEPMEQEKLLKGYVWAPVEICSPKMRLKDPETRIRMRKVISALCSSHRVAANCTCDIHIHLGRMDGRAWSLPTLKRLGSFLWVAEPTLRSIRDPNSPNFNHVYTWGFELRRRSRLAKRVEHLVDPFVCQLPVSMTSRLGEISDHQVSDSLRGQTVVPAAELAAILEIWKTASRLELGQLLSGPEKKYRRLGFNFSAFGEEDERARHNPRTFEFRIMEGSVQVDLILSWMAICGTIVEAVVARADSRFVSALGLMLRQRAQAQIPLAVDGEEREGVKRGREFRGLMQALGLSVDEYRAFEEKIMRDW
ncbi:hypothetical protein N656DRAFT_773115 [Canariomyces notabilis]|uniref:Amidoligase enzyme n=1 Tax=Canariomyces notabilis TaxID=2074819 RepID=A0AAN6TNA8_9PEZI|nr:hypothetical protein N656DRAFT_773115 [Canariomyces arenarius]